ncbi:MAG: phage tail tube protein [Mangrovicoccus sp.]
MVEPGTQNFEEMVLEVSIDGVIWNRICGLVGVTVTRQAQTDTSEVPANCANEALPLKVQKSVRSIDVSVSAEGVWASQSHGMIMDWFYSGLTKHVRIGNTAALAGTVEYEMGEAFLTQLSNQRTKGQVVSASIQIEFDGAPERKVKAAS